MDEEAAAVRALAVAVIDFGEGDPDLAAAHNQDPSMATGLWYERRCLPVCQAVQMASEACGFATKIVFGLYVLPKHIEGRYRALRHTWLELPDGTIIDPTSRQMGLSGCRIAGPDDPLRRFYRMRGWWEEDAEP